MVTEAHPAVHASAGRWLLRTLLCALSAAVIGLLTLTLLLPRLVHGAALTVRTGSMAPALAVGDLVIDRPVDPSMLRVGDIATYRQPSGTLITHRVAGVDASGPQLRFTFRGDANRATDPLPVPADAIRGRVWFAVPYVGTLSQRLAIARPVIVGAGVLALSGYALVQFAAVARDRRRRP